MLSGPTNEDYLNPRQNSVDKSFLNSLLRAAVLRRHMVKRHSGGSLLAAGVFNCSGIVFAVSTGLR
ncbi:hypothetical protein CA54_04440 [Symmachiella macrocystis]|uniref:Uncharacterized protein n=1 Tax=Symmachiella macrocystis TaxID=2527985 RepID=A0A5C6BK02_9PLAN|nr:hypothetical protein CA54_04440 [Symmachiella macrocystis]